MGITPRLSRKLNQMLGEEAEDLVNWMDHVDAQGAEWREATRADLAEQRQEMLTGFGIAFASGILLMYAVLTLLFKSFAYPITIMAALPDLLVGDTVADIVPTFGSVNMIGGELDR